MSERAFNTRSARDADVDAIVTLVNRAYEVEAFFVGGDRVTAEAVRVDLTLGTILVVDGAGGDLSGCVFVSVENGTGYFGMLAVDPAAQGRGLGRFLIDTAESYARRAGATIMTISVVNVRTDLLEFYGRLGYRRTGEAPYVHRPVIQPVHFVLMEKAL